MNGYALELGGHTLWLLPERAVWWPAQKTLLLADLHLGKARAFRQSGLAVPEGDNHATLSRLDRLITRYAPATVMLLGDVFHTRIRTDHALQQVLRDWRKSYAHTDIQAIVGNHDRDIECLDDVFAIQPEGQTQAGLTLWHHPPETTDSAPWLAGHWHPVVRMRDRGDQLRVPAFCHEANNGLVLPAFGELTGGLPIAPALGRIRYISNGEQVFRLDSSPK